VKFPRYWLRLPVVLTVLLVLVLLAMAGGVVWHHASEELLRLGAWCMEWLRETGNVLGQRPLLLFLALVVLPGLPVPSSPLLFLAGVVWREQPLFGCVFCLAAAALNMSWTYALAAGPGRRLAGCLAGRCGRNLPELSAVSHWQALLLLRLMPGVPFFVQNYLLGYLRMPFGLYLPASLACNGLIACGAVLTGAGVASGAWKPIASGIGLLVVAVILIRIARNILKLRTQRPSPDRPMGRAS
jgi:uncharacterized membrane protein YdjX (TVP38/TMEM64 family)